MWLTHDFQLLIFKMEDKFEVSVLKYINIIKYYQVYKNLITNIFGGLRIKCKYNVKFKLNAQKCINIISFIKKKKRRKT